MSRPQDAIVKLSRGESVEVAQKDGESASGEALPEGWAVTPFGDIFDFKGGSQPPKKEFYNEPAEGLIRLLQIRDFASDKYPVYIKNADKWPKCDEDDIMIARYGASLGRVLTGMAGAYNVALIRMIFDKENLDANWVRYFLISDHFQEPIHLLSRSAQNGFNKTEVSPIPVELPPLAEQSRIVSAIESLQERSSRARVLLSEVGPLIGQLRQSVLRDAFSGKLTADWRARRRMGTPESPSRPAPSEENSGFGAQATNPAQETASELLLRIRTERRERWQSEQLAKYEAKGKQPPQNWQDKYKEPEPVDESELPELPPGWCWASIDALTEFVTSGSRGWAKYYSEDGPLFLRVGNMDRDTVELDLSETVHVDPPESAEGIRTRVQENDILISVTADVGMIGLAPSGLGEAYINQHVALVRPLPSVNARAMAYSLTDPSGLQKVVQDIQYGMTKASLSLIQVRALPVPIPPPAEQAAIIQRIELAMESVTGVECGLASMESSLTQLDQSILSKAFRGELVPQDPRDEPASELLARIRTTREKLEAEKKASKKDKKTGRRTKKSAGDKAGHSRRDAPLLDALVEADGPLHVDDLRAASGLSSSEFYSRLKDAVDRGIIKEKVEKNERYLVPGK